MGSVYDVSQNIRHLNEEGGRRRAESMAGREEGRWDAASNVSCCDGVMNKDVAAGSYKRNARIKRGKTAKLRRNQA